jgi:ABC-2 type transport system ATP-binding protein
MRILATLELPSFGDAFVDGFSVINDPDSVRKRLGFMPDAFGTYANVNCAEYLDFFARAYGLVGRQRTDRVRRVLEFTGAQRMSDKPIRGLSKGMKQRLCLGRAHSRRTGSRARSPRANRITTNDWRAGRRWENDSRQ